MINSREKSAISRRTCLGWGAAALAAAATETALTPATIAADSHSFHTAAGGAVDRGIWLVLDGGPSQLDTFDPKPEAPAKVRGPFRAISTSIPGMQFTELLPRLAQQADQWRVVRSLSTFGHASHEAGRDLLAAGLIQRGWPGELLTESTGPLNRPASLIWLPAESGVSIRDHSVNFEGGTSFPQRLLSDCRRAVEFIENGPGLAIIRMFPNLLGTVNWDCHAGTGDLKSTLRDYRESIAPAFDFACTELLARVKERGLLAQTTVLAVGEFGRSSQLNPQGGRDHATGVWSGLVAGGSIAVGGPWGRSDAHGAEPLDQALSPLNFLECLPPGPGGKRQAG